MLLNTYGVGRRHKKRQKNLNIAAIPDCEFWIDLAQRDSVSFVSNNDVSEMYLTFPIYRDMAVI